MGMEPRITTSLVDLNESVIDLWRTSWQDGVCDPDEQRESDAALEESYRQAVDVDEAAAITVAMIRPGPEAPRVERLMGERRSRLRLVARNDWPDPQAA